MDVQVVSPLPGWGRRGRGGAGFDGQHAIRSASRVMSVWDEIRNTARRVGSWAQLGSHPAAGRAHASAAPQETSSAP